MNTSDEYLLHPYHRFSNRKSGLLADSNPLVRWAAVDGLADKGQKDIVPNLIDIINHDQSLWVRRAGYQALQRLTGQNFEKLQRDQWNIWWQSNKANWPPK